MTSQHNNLSALVWRDRILLEMDGMGFLLHRFCTLCGEKKQNLSLPVCNGCRDKYDDTTLKVALRIARARKK